jgi:hypothetical protein
MLVVRKGERSLREQFAKKKRHAARSSFFV